MDKGIYTALSGGIAKSHELDLIANNLANANTPGFKRDSGTFNEYLTEIRKQDSPNGVEREVNAITIADPRPQGDKSFVEMDAVYTDFKQGHLQKTGRTLDMALEGQGFFEVLTPQGSRFSRAGNFNVSADGKLVNQDGFLVLGRSNKAASAGNSIGGIGLKQVPRAGAPTEPPPEQRAIQLGQGPIEVTPEGFLSQNGVRVGQINVQEFHESQWLEKVGHTMFKNTNPQNIKAEGAVTKIHQGYIEGSNVNAVSEMTRLIEATRAYESHMQAIKTYQDIDGRSVSEIAKPSF